MHVHIASQDAKGLEEAKRCVSATVSGCCPPLREYAPSLF